MDVSFVCPSDARPIGGNAALYEFANGLSRRGHRVYLLHARFFDCGIESLDEIDWFTFEPGIEHHFVRDVDDPALPSADVVFMIRGPRRWGLPALIVQGSDMFRPAAEREAARYPCLKVCVSSWLADEVRRSGAPPEQVHTVLMGIDHSLFRPRTPTAQRPRLVGMLYHDHPAKGWSDGLAALLRAHEMSPTFEAVVFGTKRPPEALPAWITFLLSPDQPTLVEQVYGRCSVFLQSSWHEGFGFTALEAMACGSALVSTDNGGSTDYAVDGETALVAPSRDVEAMAHHVVSLLDDPGRRAELVDAAVVLVRRFDWDVAAERLEAALERYLADPDAYLQPPRDVVEVGTSASEATGSR